MNDWVVVTKKLNKRKSNKPIKPNKIFSSSTEDFVQSCFSIDDIIPYIHVLSKQISQTILFNTISNYLINIDNQNPFKIICLGIGDLIKSPISQLQLSLIIAIKQHIKCIKTLNNPNILIYDPLFLPSIENNKIFQLLEITVLNSNDKGKIVGNNDELTIFYMPHCPYQLYNNVLWSNWNNLSNIIILGNSFSAYELRRTEMKNSDCIYLLRDFVKEIDVSKVLTFPSNFQKDLFQMNVALNDLSIHYFLNSDFLNPIIQKWLSACKPSEDIINELTESDSEVR